MRNEKRKSKNPNPACDEEVSLINLEEGDQGTLSHAFGGFGLVRRLAEMGLTPGVEVKLVRKCLFRGSVQVEVRGVALALGYGVAARVFVKPLKANQNG